MKPQPDAFDFSNVGTWPTWRDRYDDYVTVSGLGQAPQDVQVCSLLYCIGPEARPLLNTFSLNAASLALYAAVAARFTVHFVHPANELYEPSRFHKRIQQPDESVDAYCAELCKLVKRCSYPSAATGERLVRGRFVVGLRDTRLSEQLCRNAKLTFTEAWTQARQSEDADKERASARLSKESSRAVQVDATKKDKVPSRRRSDAKAARASGAQAEPKPGQGIPVSHRPVRFAVARLGRSDCPARDSLCNYCRKKGHFAEVCSAKKVKQGKLGSIQLHAVETPAKAKYVDVTVNNCTEEFKVDSGAEVSAVPSDFPNVPAKLDTYRDTPGANGFSPAQVLMGRQLKTRVPKRDEQLRPNWPAKDKVASNDLAYKRQQAADYNRRHAARDLLSLRTGEQVWNAVVFFSETAISCLSAEKHNHKISPNQRNTSWFLNNHDLQARLGRPLSLSRSRFQLPATVL
ncbi:uncharacterized protein ISCGN_007781 [Ixodes scapularis]